MTFTVKYLLSDGTRTLYKSVVAHANYNIMYVFICKEFYNAKGTFGDIIIIY